MHVKDAIRTEQNVTLWANWRYRRSRYKRIQLYRTALQEVSGPIRIKLKELLSGQIVIFRANFFRPPSKMPSRTPMNRGLLYLRAKASGCWLLFNINQCCHWVSLVDIRLLPSSTWDNIKFVRYSFL